MLTLDDLKSLAAAAPCPCLTIFHPLPVNAAQAGRRGGEIDKAIRDANLQMTQQGLIPIEREEILRPVRELASTIALKPGPGSLVVFRSPSLTITDFWPEKLTPRVHFSKEFLILPLLPALLHGNRFWLLALSVKSVRLFKGSADGLTPISLPAGLATSLSEHGAFRAPDHNLHGRSSAGPSAGKMKGVQFGTSNLRELQPAYLHDFFKAIDRGIRPILASDDQPLILAAVQRELAIYREVNSYCPTLDEAIKGSPAFMDLAVLHAKASRLLSTSSFVTESIERELKAAVDRNLLITKPVEIVDAAGTGLIEKLIISPTISGEPREPTVNWAALATLRNSGSLSLLDAPETRMGCAAILRFRSDVSVVPPEQELKPTV